MKLEMDMEILYLSNNPILYKIILTLSSDTLMICQRPNYHKSSSFDDHGLTMQQRRRQRVGCSHTSGTQSGPFNQNHESALFLQIMMMTSFYDVSSLMI